MACNAGRGPPSESARLVVIDPNCSHCTMMHTRLNRDKAVLRQQNIHVYVLNGTESDPLYFATRGGCTFPHCFEFMKNPSWARPYARSSAYRTFVSMV